MAVTAGFILQGYAYSLEQCGQLLRDANLAYENSSYATAVVLTRFAQEKFGQARILLDLWRRASAGETFTTQQPRDACKDHEVKQRAGMGSLNLSVDRDTSVGKVLSARMTSPLGSTERQKADATLEQIDKTMRRRKISPVLYAAAILLAFVSPWVSIAIYVMVAMWLVPDRRIESVLREKSK
jgi:AbiV family abortive infection protein